MADATTLEMDQFLRLMFDPVAGRMIHTLFLERLRAERVLAPPAGLKIERIERGPITAARQDWAAALARLKVAEVDVPALGDDTIELVDSQGGRHRLALRVLADTPAATPLPQAVLAPAGPYGRVLGAGTGHRRRRRAGGAAAGRSQGRRAPFSTLSQIAL